MASKQASRRYDVTPRGKARKDQRERERREHPEREQHKQRAPQHSRHLSSPSQLDLGKKKEKKGQITRTKA